MRTFQQWGKDKLEFISTEPKPQTQSLKKLSFFNRIWGYFRDLLTLNEEPQIWETIDHSGKVWWKIYDPVSDEFFQLESQQEVLIWLEERYHRRLQKRDWDPYTW
jgi:hypothetical protein